MTTAPTTPPPPGGPGRDDLYGEYGEQLTTVGCGVIDPLVAWAETIAAAAPPLTDEQFAFLAPLFSRTPARTGPGGPAPRPLPAPGPPPAPGGAA